MRFALDEKAQISELDHTITAAAVAERTTTSLFMVGESGLCIYANPAAEKLTGYTREEFLGRTLHEMLHHSRPDGAPYPPEECALDRALHGASDVVQAEQTLIRRDGTFFPALITVSPLLDDGRQIGSVSEVRDLTETKAAQEELRVSEARYRSLMEATASIVWNVSASGELTSDQPGWRAFTGQSPGEYSGTGWLEAVHPDDRARTIEGWREALATRSVYQMEHRLRRFDGEYVEMLVRAVPITDHDGDVTEWVGIHTDVTRTRTLQKLLDAERLRLREIFMRAPALIAIVSGPEHVYEVANPPYLRIVGRDVIGKPVAEALPELESQGYIALLDRVFRSGEPYSQREARVVLERHAQPEELFVDFLIEPIFDISRSVTGIFIHGTDVTAQVHARRELERQARELEQANTELQYQSRLNRTITDNAGSSLFMMDERGHPTFMNPAAEQVTGYTLQEIEGAPLHEAVHHHHPDGRPYPMEECPIDNGREKLVPLRDYRDVFVRKDGSFFPVSCHLAPLEREGRTSGAVLEFRDITAEMRAHEVLREADRRKDDFLATLSHELRTPLTVILGWASLLRMGSNDPETVRTAVETIDRSAHAQAQLIDDVLDLSKIVSGKIRIDSDIVDVNEVMHEAVEGVRLAAAAREITLEQQPAEGNPRILGDAGRLQQIIWNLVINAIKFTPPGGEVEVSVTCDESFVSVVVHDNGIGIAPAFLPHVFEPFRQSEASTTRVYGGLGLGLSIVRHLVELHGGHVSAESPGEGEGASFTVRLPLLRSEVRAPEGEVRKERAAVASSTGLADLGGVTVLVLDDQQAVRDYFAAVLHKAGATARAAASVQDAIWSVQEAMPDVILCDIAMPHADGYSFIRWFRSVPWARRIPVVAVTAFGRPDDRDRVLSAGFDGYLRKPVESGALARVVAETARKATHPE